MTDTHHRGSAILKSPEMRLGAGLTATRAAPGSAQAGRLQLVGYAAVFDVEATIGGAFRERIARGAFDEALARDNVVALLNHDPSQILGRTSAGDLRLSVDAHGLRYEVDIDPEDELAMRVHRWVRRRKITQSSFGFKVDAQDVRHDPQGGLPLRIITKATLYDVSPVTFPAYTETSVTAADLARAGAPAGPAAARLSRPAPAQDYLHQARVKLAEHEADVRRDEALAALRRRPTQGTPEGAALLRLPSDRRPSPRPASSRRRLPRRSS